VERSGSVVSSPICTSCRAGLPGDDSGNREPDGADWTGSVIDERDSP
jgi:hypothetical protein